MKLLTHHANKRQSACCGFAKSILLARLAFQAMVLLVRNAVLRFGFASLAPFVCSYLPSGLVGIFLLIATGLSAYPGFHEPWGKDSDLKPAKIEEARPKASLATKVADAIIRFHQEVISPVDGPRSNYRPTSSRYMQLAMQRYGFFKGAVMGFDRLLRENDEEWVYRKIEVDGKLFKYDPAKIDKYH